LIVSGTGALGMEACRLLAARAEPTRALVRASSSPEKLTELKELGAELTTGDLKDPASLRAACRGVSAIISSATSVHSQDPANSIETVDRQGQLALIDAAEAAGVKHFVLVSFPPVAVDFPLQSAKRAVEYRLRKGLMSYTILQPTFFTEVWLSPALGFDPASGKATIYGAGKNKTSWISFRDVAACAVAALNNPRAANATIELGGPDALSPLEAVRLAEGLVGKPVEVQHVPEEALRAQHAAATDLLQKTFAGLMLYYADGDVIDMAEARRVLSVDRFRSVREYFQEAVIAATH
ncbi:MAG TPA: SDR family oxidoreductase, partial [Gemmatimonadales bacterium]|nr:SDR family oxidoreductase [Gemmatimonadales bacterium]